MKAKTTKKATTTAKKAAVAKPAVSKTENPAPKAPKTASATKVGPKKSRVTFTYRAEPGSSVYLAGSFNNWDPDAKPMVDKKKVGVYSASVMLAPGSYEYKFVIDGTWCADPECSDWVQNDHGTLNSVKHVGIN